MTTTMSLRERSEVVGRPRYEGSNICTWIGFKHVMYLVEEAVLDHLRQSGVVPRSLYEEHSLGVDIVESDARIATALHMDDEVRTEVVSQPPDDDGALVFRTTTYAVRPDGPVKAVTAKVRVQIRPAEWPAAPLTDGPAETVDGRNGGRRVDGQGVDGQGAVGRGAVGLGAVARHVDGRGAVGTTEPDLAALVGDANAIVWRWRVPYFYCHFSQHLQHSGYLRLMEEVVDLFLAERGISIRTMLDGRRWIPVVPRAHVRILAPALMEEEIYTVFTVEEIFKDVTYTARMDCYVRRDGRLLHTATGRITHGYAEVLDRRDWKLVPFDGRTTAALRGEA